MSRETLHFETQDEAIAEAMRGAAAGEVIEIHAAECQGREAPRPPYAVVGCTCKPMTMRAGARA